jgi:hypothetical protein
VLVFEIPLKNKKIFVGNNVTLSLGLGRGIRRKETKVGRGGGRFIFLN